MKAGFRGWLYRFVSALFGLVGVVVFLSAAELVRFYGFPQFSTIAYTGLAVSFFLWLTAFIGAWSWKRYAVLCLVAGCVLGFPYLALRPEMIRDDVLKQLTNPPLSVDLVFYRNWALRDDAERDLKIERLQFVYGLIASYGENAKAKHPTAPIPEAK
ncbi:MAG: hypothetical protein JST04_14985 [Bdellovibrionales bacterium]|nr:hypothetical protein [Bdellovibrionales bacterium]